MNIDDLLLELFIKGISVKGECNRYLDLRNEKLERFKRFDFYLNEFRYSTYMEEEDLTPFSYIDGELFYYSDILKNIDIKRIEDVEWGSESTWYIKTWNNLERSPYELRLNPINICANLRFVTGENGEFRGCAFCHRVYAHGRSAENRKIETIHDIFNDIFLQEGEDILNRIKKVLIMTGNMKKPEDLLTLCHETYSILMKKQYKGVFSISTNQICAEESIKELASIDNTIFDYTLETFERRSCLMGKQKGYSMDKVINTLKCARKYFRYIRINYVVGLDSYDGLESGFVQLKKLGLIDDVIPLIFVPYTPEMKKLRNKEATEISYYKRAKLFFKSENLVPQKNGLTKNLFQEDRLNNRKMDDLMETSYEKSSLD